MKKLVVLLALSVLGAAAFAQNTVVSGQVLDSLSRAGEPSAVIQFFKASDSQKPIAFTTTGEDGSFSHLLQGKGEYFALFTQVGRKDVRRSFTLDGSPEVIIGTILAQDDVEMLGGSTVTAQKVLVKMEVDKMTYEVAEDVDSKTATVLDMLRKVPMVTVDAQDNITVNGSSSFQVTVDGKPNPMLSANASTVFKVMPASAVKSIEVITNPGVKYDAEGVGGVLNITTNTSVTGGAGAADGHYGSVRVTGGTQNTSAGLYYSLQKGRFSMSLDGDLGYQSMKDMEQENTLTSGSFETYTKRSMNMRSPMARGSLSVGYEIDSLNLLSLNAGIMSFNQRQSGDLFTRSNMQKLYFGATADDGGGSPLYQYSGDFSSANSWNMINAGLDFQHSWADAPGRLLTLSYRLSMSPGSSESESSYRDLVSSVGDDNYLQPSLPSDRKAEGTNNSVDNTFQADLTFPISEGHTLSTGLKFTRRHNYSSDTDKLPYAWLTEYDYFNSIAAAYGEYSGTFGKFGVKGGLRYEFTWQNIENSLHPEQNFKTSYGALVPTASLQYNIGLMQNIGLSYNVRISRPGITYLNPYVNMSDPTMISYGNSDLKISHGHNLSLVYNFFTPIVMMNATLRHSYSGDGISDYSFYQAGLLNTTYGNILESRNTGMSLFVNVNLGKKTRIYANASAGYSDYRSEELSRHSYGWNFDVFAGAQQTVFWDLQLSANFMYNSRSTNLQGWNSGFSGIMGGVTKTFLSDRLSVSLNGITGFSKGGSAFIKMYSEGQGYSSLTRIKIPIAQAMLSVSWTFGRSGVQVKKAQRSITDDDILNTRAGDNIPSVGGGM